MQKSRIFSSREDAIEFGNSTADSTGTGIGYAIINGGIRVDWFDALEHPQHYALGERFADKVANLPVSRLSDLERVIETGLLYESMSEDERRAFGCGVCRVIRDRNSIYEFQLGLWMDTPLFDTMDEQTYTAEDRAQALIDFAAAQNMRPFVIESFRRAYAEIFGENNND